MKKRSSPYNISDVMQKHNITEEEAIERINKYKLQTSQSILGFIFRYGDELGHIKFEEFKNKSKTSISNFKKRFGDEWEIKWEHYMSTRNTRSLEFFIKKYGNDLGTIKLNEVNTKWLHTLSKQGFIDRFGSEGEQKYAEFNKSKDASSLNSCITRYGNNGNEIYKERCLSRDSMSLEFHIKKYGVHGTDMYNARKLYVSPIFNELKKIYGIDNAIIAYNDYLLGKPDKTTKIAQDNLAKRFANISMNKCKSPVSKQSIYLFSELERALDRKLSYGSKKKELKLFDHINFKTYFYDCYDICTNTIIEFNGSAFHANPMLSKIEQGDWHTLYGKSYEDSLLQDNIKINFAKSMGYNIIIIWDYEIRGKVRLHNKIMDLITTLKGNV